MNFIVFRHFKNLAICGEVDLPVGTELYECGGFVALGGVGIITRIYSDNYCRHFSRNDDGQGIERGKLAYAIAYSERNAGNGFRFSDDEQSILRRDWAHFLMPYADAILFNNAFFDAPVDELKKLAEAVGVI